MSAADREIFDQQVQRVNEVLHLFQKRQELLKCLKEVDQQINSCVKFELKVDQIETPVQPTAVEIPTKVEVVIAESTTPSPVVKSKRGRKPKGEFSLTDSIMWLVQDHPDGLRLSEIVEKILLSGYKSSSKDFAGVVASTLSALKANGRLSKTEDGKFLILSK